MSEKQYLHIKGGRPLMGDVQISGSKNSVLALIPGLCIGQGTGKLTNAPHISDVGAVEHILGELGVSISVKNNEITVGGNLRYSKLSPAYVSKIRASNLFLGVLLSKYGKAQVPISGGDKIGDRPIDIHIEVFKKFGIVTEIEGGYINCQATQFPYGGQTIFLRYPSVGATENALLIASTATGSSVIYNAAMEPEIVDLAILLNEMGASVSGAGTPIIRIKPSAGLTRVEHEIIPDRLEAGTFLLYLAATRGRGTIYNVVPEHLMSVIAILTDGGVGVTVRERSITIDATSPGEAGYSGININALPYPGTPTDLQPFLAVYASTCQSDSTIMDSVHRERFAYLYELRKMGLLFDHRFDQSIIKGSQRLAGAEVEGADIRMTAALVLGGLIASGETNVFGLHHLHRGYDDFINKLKLLGADVWESRRRIED